MIEKICAHRKNKPLVIIDLGVPRNAESLIKNIEQVYLFSLEDIESFSNENLRARESEAEKAKVLINDLCSLNDEGLKEKVSRKELYSALTKLIQGATEDFKTKLLNSNDPIKALNEINDAEIKLPKNINDIESYALRSMIRRSSMLPESVLNKLNSLVLRKKDLEDQLSSEGATEDISKFTSLNKEYSEITPVVELYGNYNHSFNPFRNQKKCLILRTERLLN